MAKTRNSNIVKFILKICILQIFFVSLHRILKINKVWQKKKIRY